jgi:hypothetical protein
MRLHDSPRDVEPESRSVSVRSLGSPIAIEYVREIFRAMPRPVPAIVIESPPSSGRAQSVTIPPSGVNLIRVAEQVREPLRDAVRVGVNLRWIAQIQDSSPRNSQVRGDLRSTSSSAPSIAGWNPRTHALCGRAGRRSPASGTRGERLRAGQRIMGSPGRGTRPRALIARAPPPSTERRVPQAQELAALRIDGRGWIAAPIHRLDDLRPEPHQPGAGEREPASTRSISALG